MKETFRKLLSLLVRGIVLYTIIDAFIRNDRPLWFNFWWALVMMNVVAKDVNEEIDWIIKRFNFKK